MISSTPGVAALPVDHELEDEALGAVMVKNDVLDAIEAAGGEELFDARHSRQTFRAMRALRRGGQPIDFVTLGRSVDSNVDRVWLSRLGDGVGRVANVEAYTARLGDLALRRRLIAQARRDEARLHNLHDPVSSVIADHSERLRTLPKDHAEEGFAQPAALLVERNLRDPPPPLVPHMIASDGSSLWHGQPRDGKTYTALACALALSAGKCALGLHYDAPEPMPVAFVTNEDSRSRCAERLDLLRSGLGLNAMPSELFEMVHSGLWLDDPVHQARLLRDTQRLGLRVLFFDTMRSLTACVDQGPREWQPCARFLRALQAEASVTIVMSHHDVKPPSTRPQARRRPHRVSGGGIYSFAEAPVSFERLADEPLVTSTTPTGWKFSGDPEPLTIQLAVEGRRAWLSARLTTSLENGPREFEGMVTSWVASHPGSTGRQVVGGLRANRSATLEVLRRLETRGVLRRDIGPRRSDLWSVVPAVPSGSWTGRLPSGSGGSHPIGVEPQPGTHQTVQGSDGLD